MKISAIPYAGMDTATTRLRFYAALNALPKEHVWAKCGKRATGDVLYIQKSADDDTLKKAVAARRDGIKVVYDLGDPALCEDGAHRKAMMGIADVVTTDTDIRAKALSQYAKAIVVVPDCIDYEGTYREFLYVQAVNRIVTFGNTASIAVAVEDMDYLPMKKVYISNRENKDFKNATFVEWKYHSFIKNLAKNDVCYLKQSDDAKSNNRLLVCMRLGIPFIVGNSTSYRQTLESMGLEFLIACDSDDITETIEDFMAGSNDRRAEIAAVAKKHAENFTADKSALKLLDAFNTALGNV